MHGTDGGFATFQAPGASPRMRTVHPFRRATMGSIREARNAGRYPARSAQAIRIAIDAPIARGSFGLTPNKNDFRKAVVW